MAEKVAEEWPKIMKAEQSPRKSKRKKARTTDKTKAAYWTDKIQLEKKPGWKSSNYFVRIQALGTRRKVKLNSTYKDEAAREAMALFKGIFANGWPKEEGEHLPTSGDSSLPKDPTIEDWVTAVRAKTMLAEGTVDKYYESLQTIVGEVLGIPRARKPEKRALIKAFPVASITKDTLANWQASRIKATRKLDAVAEQRALNTIRSLIVNARSLFTDDIFEAFNIDVEELKYKPFKRLKLPKKGDGSYSSRFDAVRLLATATRELAGDPSDYHTAEDPKFEQWKILYLALVAGLRYKEIDRLRIQDINTNKEIIAVRLHETFKPKTDASLGDIGISRSASDVIDGMIKRTSGRWIIKDGAPNKSSRYRASEHHDALVEWLKNYEERGFKPFADIQKPIHELRKEAGSFVNKEHGLVATQKFLRHKSILTTAGSYVEAKGKITTGLG